MCGRVVRKTNFFTATFLLFSNKISQNFNGICCFFLHMAHRFQYILNAITVAVASWRLSFEDSDALPCGRRRACGGPKIPGSAYLCCTAPTHAVWLSNCNKSVAMRDLFSAVDRCRWIRNTLQTIGAIICALSLAVWLRERLVRRRSIDVTHFVCIRSSDDSIYREYQHIVSSSRKI